jgi:predicted nucleic acid-binding protein
MASKILTFVDASVLIYAAVKPTAATIQRRMRALQVLGDPDRDFAASEYLKLEVLPLSVYFGRTKETSFYETFFAGVSTWVDPHGIISPALALASQYGLGAIDALHVVAAATVGAEFVSAEKPTKPIYRAYALASSIY